MFLLAVNACDEHRVRDDGTGNADPEVLNVLTRVLHRAEGDASQAGLCKYAWSGVAVGTTAASKGCSSQRSVCAARDASRMHRAGPVLTRY